VFFARFSFDFLTLELGGGGFENGFEPFVGGVLGDGVEDGETFFWREPGGGHGGVEADASR